MDLHIPPTASSPNAAFVAEGKLDLSMIRQPDPAPLKVTSAFSLAALRVAQDFDAGQVEQPQQTVPIAKPQQLQTFFRAHKDWSMAAHVIEHRHRLYVVTSAVAAELEGDTKLRMLVPCVTRDGDLFVWHFGVMKAAGKTDDWTLSANRAWIESRSNWIRLVSGDKFYRAIKPSASWPDPTWPELTLEEVFERAFGESVIDSLEHPVVRTLRGES